MSWTADLFDNPIKRTALISGLITIFLLFFAWVIPLAENPENEFYSFLYEDLEKPEEDRFNWSLVLLESILLSLFFFFGLVFLGSVSELRNNLPSWGEVVLVGIATLFFTFLLPSQSVRGGIAGTQSSTGFNHFTADMRTATYLFTILGMILLTIYMVKSEDSKK